MEEELAKLRRRLATALGVTEAADIEALARLMAQQEADKLLAELSMARLSEAQDDAEWLRARLKARTAEYPGPGARGSEAI